MKTRSHTLLVLAALALGAGCAPRRPPAAPPPPPAPVETAHTFADIPVRKLRADPDAYVGTVFDETFVFSRVWWGRDRKRPGKPALDIPTHFTARIAASPVHMARIEFPPEADPLFEDRRAGTPVRLRVRFLRLQPASHTPIFAFEKMLPDRPPGSDLEYLKRR